MARPEVTGRKVGGLPSESKSVTLARPPPSERGTLGLSIPQAGRMVGLSRASSYAAAERGEIPTLNFGRRKIVPKALWLRRLGVVSGEGETA
jgi:hypothetical protein